MYFITPERESQ